MSNKDLVFERRPQGDFAVRRGNSERASAVARTQAEAIAEARRIEPSATELVKRVRQPALATRISGGSHRSTNDGATAIRRKELSPGGGSPPDGRAKPFAPFHPELQPLIRLSGRPSAVLTIENYASFNRCAREIDDSALVVYTGGFASLA